MGTYICIAISKSVTKQEWKNVYEETLNLIKHLPLAEKKKVKIHDIDTTCLVKSEEHEHTFGWNNKNTVVGWHAEGDYYYMATAEEQYTPRDIIKNNEVEECAGDAMFGILPAYINSYYWSDDRFSHVYNIWGNKTQSEPYHIYLLAVAALIEARLGTKACTYGDITKKEFERAVEIANKYLEKPICPPDRCDMYRLIKRIKKFPVDSNEQLQIFEKFYIGALEKEFGKYAYQNFSENDISYYWKNKFAKLKIGEIDFDKVLNEYLLWGFRLEEVCNYINFELGSVEENYEKFVRRILDAKLHIKDKNCVALLEPDQKMEEAYDIDTLLAQLKIVQSKKNKLNIYIPIEKIKLDLINSLASKCNVKDIIDKYLEEERKQIETNTDIKDINNDNIVEEMIKNTDNEKKKYDIEAPINLMCYKDGDTIHPIIKNNMLRFIKFVDSLSGEYELHMLLEKDAKQCCEWLANNNKYILISDEKWDRIYSNIEKDIEAFKRYYGLLRVKVNSMDIVYMCKAFMVNDKLYDYFTKLANEK